MCASIEAKIALCLFRSFFFFVRERSNQRVFYWQIIQIYVIRLRTSPRITSSQTRLRLLHSETFERFAFEHLISNVRFSFFFLKKNCRQQHALKLLMMTMMMWSLITIKQQIMLVFTYQACFCFFFSGSPTIFRLLHNEKKNKFFEIYRVLPQVPFYRSLFEISLRVKCVWYYIY